MKFDSTFYDLTQEAYSAAVQVVLAHMPHSSDPADQPSVLSQLRRGRAESPSWYLVQALEFDPEPLTCENIKVRDTYACDRIVSALLELMASEDWLERDNHANFFLTETGRLTFQRRQERLQTAIQQTTLLSEVKLARVAKLVKCIIDASLASSTPPGVWCLSHSRNRAPRDDTSQLTQLIQFFDDINAFRDDCHMAAWQQLNVEGYIWETFSLVQRGEAHTTDIVFHQLMHRGYSRIEYQTALSFAERRGWIEKESDMPASYRITQGGQILWQQVEEMTDQYFYAPWACLADSEVDELYSLLTELKRTTE